MRYRIEYADQRLAETAECKAELLAKIKGREVLDVRRIYKSGVTDSVLPWYQKYIKGGGGSCGD